MGGRLEAIDGEKKAWVLSSPPPLFNVDRSPPCRIQPLPPFETPPIPIWAFFVPSPLHPVVLDFFFFFLCVDVHAGASDRSWPLSDFH